MSEIRRWRLAWLVVCALGALVAWRSAWEFMEPCICLDLRLRYIVKLAEFVVMPLIIAIVFAIAGIAGWAGLIDGLFRVAGRVGRAALHSRAVQGFARSGAVRWAFGLAAVPWSIVFLYGCAIAARPSSGRPEPDIQRLHTRTDHHDRRTCCVPTHGRRAVVRDLRWRGSPAASRMKNAAWRLGCDGVATIFGVKRDCGLVCGTAHSCRYEPV
jgi:hypothetical protein